MPPIRTFLDAVALVLPATAIAAGPIVMHRDPGCGCCEPQRYRKQARGPHRPRLMPHRDHRRHEF